MNISMQNIFNNDLNKELKIAEMYSEPCQTSKMEPYSK